MRIGLDPIFLLSLSSQRSEEHTSELQSQSNLVCRLLLEKKNIHSHLTPSKNTNAAVGTLANRRPRSSHSIQVCAGPAAAPSTMWHLALVHRHRPVPCVGH